MRRQHGRGLSSKWQLHCSKDDDRVSGTAKCHSPTQIIRNDAAIVCRCVTSSLLGPSNTDGLAATPPHRRASSSLATAQG